MNALRCIHACVVVLAVSSGCASEEFTDESKAPLVRAPQEYSNASVTWFQDEERRYGLRTTDGKQVLAPTYDDVRHYSEGLAAVNLGAEWVFPGIPDGGEWGYVNESGELVIPIQFQYANDFSDGLANVSNWASGEGTMFIDRSGVVQIRIPNANAGDFREGLAPVHRDRSLKGEGWLTEYIDKTGATVFTVKGYGEEFYDGFAVVIVRGGKAKSNEGSSYGYINRKGEVAIEPRFGEALHFSDGLAAVRTQKTTVYGMGDQWGYIDQFGKFVIDPIYNEARPFRDGKAMVHEGGQLILVYDAPCYWEGGSWWLIDKQGKQIGKIVD